MHGATVMITARETTLLVELDFGDGQVVHVKPEVAQTLVSDQATKENLRRQIQECHRQRRKALADELKRLQGTSA